MFYRFLIVGSTGFLIDSSVTLLLISFGCKPLIARVPALALSMAMTWLMNRFYTFKVGAYRTGEVTKYVLVSISIACLNYVLYAMLVARGVAPFFAVALATATQAGIAFVAYRNIVFK